MRAYIQTACIIFGVIAVVHVLRLHGAWVVQVAGRTIPVWASWVSIGVAGGLLLWAFKLLRVNAGQGSYLQHGRLGDVLRLIQVLAYGPASRRTDDGLRKEFEIGPLSGASWQVVAAQHPELFRVRSDVEKPFISLISRFMQEEEVTLEGEKRHPPLTPDAASSLIELAIELHDREVRRSQEWHVYLPVIVAITAGVFTLFGLALKGWLGVPEGPT
jgi:hypothetical protein